MRKLSLLLCLGLTISLNAFAEGEVKAVDASKPEWTFEKYNAAMKESGRKVNISEKTFKEIQERKPAAIKNIESYLKSHLGSADPAVLKAFGEVPREYYHYNYKDNFSFAANAYEESAKPWAIGYGSALSDYLGQAYMTQLAKPAPDKVALEVGTGSGFQSSLLSRLVRKVYSIEIIEPLGTGVKQIYKPLGYSNVETRVGDGFFGWPEAKGGFDIIIVTCTAQFVPPALLEQLRPGGRLLIPVGQPLKKHAQVLYIYTKDEQGKVHSKKDIGMNFIPMTGAIQKQPAAGADAPKP
jgi:protein-L-isoaspartate(D-aspartate) O-methyltransferase